MIERMQLQVTFPLECGTENRPTKPQSALNEPYVFHKAMSGITQHVDAQISADIRHVRQRSMPVRQYDYHTTPTQPIMVPQFNPPPDMGSYYPNYTITQPSVPAFSMEKKEDLHEPKEKEVFSNGEILSLYNTKLRDFDVAKLRMPAKSELDVREVSHKIEPRPLSVLASATERDMLFRNPTCAEHLGPYNVRYEEHVPVFVDMRGQKERVIFPVDPEKDKFYPHVAEQLDKTKPRTQVFCDMKRERSRNPSTSRNKRVEMLDKLKQEHKDFLAELKPKVRSRSVKKRPKSSFACQTPRKAVFCDSRVDELPEEVFPYDPMKSFLKTKPRVRAIAIKDRRNITNPAEFWRAAGQR